MKTKMKKLSVILFLLIFSIQIFGITSVSSFAEEEPQIIVSDISVDEGNEAEVTVSLKNNPGIVSMRLEVGYDSSVLTLKGVKDAGKLGVQSHSNQFKNPYVLSWVNDTAIENFTYDGIAVTLVFEINETEKGKSYPITVSYDPTNYEVYDKDINQIIFQCINGSITYGTAEKGNLIFEENGDIRYYENHVPISKGLVRDEDGSYYFINSTLKAVKNCWYAFNANSANGLLPAGKYYFGADGKMVTEGLVKADGEVRYYENGKPVAKGLVRDEDGSYYFINSTLKAVKNCWYAFSANSANGLPLAGKYLFGADGKMIIPNDGLVFEENGDIRYYENGKPVAKGLVRDEDGSYYFINSTLKAVKNCEYAFSVSSANGLMPAGKYLFGADGKLITE